MDIRKGDILVYVGEPQERFEAGEEVIIVGKTPKGVKVEFDDNSLLEIHLNILKRDWELKENGELSEEDELKEDLKENLKEKTKIKKPKKFKEPKEKKQSLKKESKGEVLQRRAAFIALVEKKGLSVIEQVPFTAIKWGNRVVFELYRGAQRFAFNCNENGLSSKSKLLGEVKGHGRTNDFLVQNVLIDVNLEQLVDESIRFIKESIKALAEERKESAKNLSATRKAIAERKSKTTVLW